MIDVVHGNSPLILAFPHTGTDVPPDCLARLNETGRALADTDWHIDRLYAGLVGDITTIRTPIHRYVIDVNRGADDASLYPGQNTTGLCPTTDFDGRAIYLAGREPDAAEVQCRTQTYHAPYHAALTAEVARIHALHGFAILYDCHSIRSDIPFLFDGTLPDFNIGTNNGASSAPEIEQLVLRDVQAAAGYTSVLNGRFKGGWTTRHYGRPAQGIHAVQMELAQSTYMTEAPPWPYDTARADALRAHLKTILTDLQNWRPQ